MNGDFIRVRSDAIEDRFYAGRAAKLDMPAFLVIFENRRWLRHCQSDVRGVRAECAAGHHWREAARTHPASTGKACGTF